MERESIKDWIYDPEGQYRRALAVLERDKGIVRENRVIIRRFVEDRFAVGIGKIRAVIIISHLRRLAHLTDKSFSELGEGGLRALMLALEGKGYSVSNKNTCKSVLKTLLRSFGESEDFFGWIKLHSAPSMLRAEDLLSEGEMGAMVAATGSVMWKALLGVLFVPLVQPGENTSGPFVVKEFVTAVTE